MKQFLPYNILFVLALGSVGLILLYNTVLRESYTTTLRYSYPAAEEPTQQATRQTAPPQQEITYMEIPEVLPEEPIAEETEPETAAEPGAEEIPPPEEPAGVQFPLDINIATVDEILLIPGVGNTMAQRIVQYREYIGGAYSDLEQLKNISGVGEQTYAKLWAYFTVDGEDDPERIEEPGGVEYAEIPEEDSEEQDFLS